ncbi:MAG: transposase, partial [Christensenellaceae bacterium]
IYDFACNCSPSLPHNESSSLLISNAISQLNCINETIASLAKQMNSLSSTLPEYDVVLSFFGVGSVLGSQLIAEIDDVSRFPNKKALVGFAGLDAPPFQSGSFHSLSRKISKRGSSDLRKTLFQVMSVILQKAPSNNSVFQFMNKKRDEGKHFYVYMTAAANKFLRIYFARVTELLISLQTVS